MQELVIDNYIISESLINIIYRLRQDFPSHKLKDVKDKGSEIVLTCVNSGHANGTESNPDAHINLDSSKAGYGVYHCFACDTATDFIGFIALYLDRPREYAKQWLIQHYGILKYEKLNIGEDICINKKSTPIKKLDESILDTYQNYCPYLAKRKLSREICSLFNVKYDSVNRNIVFPVYDAKGNLVMLARRHTDYKMFHMDKDVEKPVYCLDYIIKNNISTCLITEGPFDTLTAYQYGFPAIGTLGAISDYQIEQINKSCISVLYLMCDNDSAGQRFNNLLQRKLDKRIITVPVTFPNGKKDINDLTKEEMINCIKLAKTIKI